MATRCTCSRCRTSLVERPASADRDRLPARRSSSDTIELGEGGQHACVALIAAIGLAPDVTPTAASAQGQLRVPRFAADPLWNKPLPNKWTTGQVSGVAVDSHDHRLGRPSAGVDRGRREGRLVQPATGGVLHSGPSDSRVRSGRQPGQRVRRSRRRLRMALHRARDLRRPQGQRLDGRQRAGRRPHPEVHATRGSSCCRSAAGARARAATTSRTWGGRPASSCTRRPTSCSSPTATGTAASSSSTPRPARTSATGARTERSRKTRRCRRARRSSRDRRRRCSTTPCTRSWCRTTMWSTSPTAGTTVCRSSRSTARSSGKSSSRGRRCRAKARCTTSRFSPDKEQRFLYVVDGSNKWVHILNRKTLEIVDSVGGRAGHGAQEFFHIHSMATDSKGNIYLGEVNQGQRYMKYAFKGMGAPGTP